MGQKDGEKTELGDMQSVLMDLKLNAEYHQKKDSVKKSAQRRALVRRAIEDYTENRRLEKYL